MPALSQAGQDCREIEALTGVAAETVQLWLRQDPQVTRVTGHGRCLGLQR
jgi:hypothetical protein